MQAEALFPEAVAHLSRAPSLEFNEEDIVPAAEVPHASANLLDYLRMLQVGVID